MSTKSQQLRAHIAKGGCYLGISVLVERRGDEVLRTPPGRGKTFTRKTPKRLSKKARHRAEVAAHAKR